MATTVVATVAQLLLERGWTAAPIKRLNYRAFAVTALAFVAANAVLFTLAICRA